MWIFMLLIIGLRGVVVYNIKSLRLIRSTMSFKRLGLFQVCSEVDFLNPSSKLVRLVHDI